MLDALALALALALVRDLVGDADAIGRVLGGEEATDEVEEEALSGAGFQSCANADNRIPVTRQPTQRRQGGVGRVLVAEKRDGQWE